MSFVGEATGVFGLLGKSLEWLRERRDPAYAQAKRLTEVFECYGIARHQIPRILPSELKLPNAAFSTPDKLKDKVIPEWPDGAAGYLLISRSWLDGWRIRCPTFWRITRSYSLLQGLALARVARHG